MARPKTSAAARGYGSAWQRLRARALARDAGLCQSCDRQGLTTPARAVDHIRPKAQGGLDTLDNTQCLCDPCHADKTTRENGVRPRPVIGLDGWPVAPLGRYVGPLWVKGRPA